MPNEKITLFFSKLEQTLNDLPAIIGNEVVNYSLEAFEKQSWDGVEWEEVKDKKKQGQAILVRTARLKRSVRVISSSPTSVIVGSDVPYAAIHNNGGIIQRASRTELFTRNRYTKGPKSKYFGGLGAYKKGIVSRSADNPGIRGLTYKAYNILMPRRRYLGINQELKDRIRARVISEIKNQ